MSDCVSESALREIGDSFLDDFEKRLPTLPSDLSAPFHDEARQLETQLMCLYRATVICVRKVEDMAIVAKRWAEMVGICDSFLEKLRKLQDQHPACGANIYYDQVFDLRSKCLRLREMHQ